MRAEPESERTERWCRLVGCRGMARGATVRRRRGGLIRALGSPGPDLWGKEFSKTWGPAELPFTSGVKGGKD
ncbi:hypothetical protein NDU88_003249 [Pleurodeles waltl]|uniref:Uncharacterized protein n=1 Tax=Pleurodeles waltl TaxID=8319 RepID=A0AAV7KYE9_PLEWA|nr:hypothetical protein NDU88_003249 [Pleurodeles waltl]